MVPTGARGTYEKLRKAAKDQPCVRCGRNDGTTVGAHYSGVRRHAYGGGLGRKVHDLVLAHLCASCHAHFDTGAKDKEGRWLLSEELQHLVLLTILRLWAQGVIGLLP